MKYKYLVIGSNSFSGSHFTQYLISKKESVFGISRSKEPNKVFLPYKWNNQKKKFNNDHFVYAYYYIQAVTTIFQ